MAFTFDTGDRGPSPYSASEGMRDAWLDAVTDMAGGPGAPRHLVLRRAADQIITDMWSVKRPETVRYKFYARIDLIREMAGHEPTAHDRVIMEFAERISMLATDVQPDQGEPAPAEPEKPTRHQQPEKEYDDGF